MADDHFDVRNTEFVNLLSNLGPGTLRFGGNAVEHTGWSRSKRAKAEGEQAVLTPEDLDRMFAFAKAIGWRVILGLNLAHGDPARAADEAAYAVTGGGAQLSAIEIGNEPDLYVRAWHFRPPSWQYQDFRNEFESYVHAIRAREPRTPIAGPATAQGLGATWFPEFLKDEGSVIAFATQHLYPMSAAADIGPDSPRYATIANMLSPASMQRVSEQVQQFAQATEAAHVRLRMGETNSASRGGKDGVSNVFAAALWGADYAFTLAESGADGLNFHSGFECRGYTPICRSGSEYVVQPLYYGMLLFHAAMPRQVVPVTVESSANMAAHAVVGSDARLALVLVNKDPREPVRVQIQGTSARRAKLLSLTGDAFDSASGIKFGGHAVSADGKWSPDRGETILSKRHVFEMTAPPASALLVQFEK